MKTQGKFHLVLMAYLTLILLLQIGSLFQTLPDQLAAIREDIGQPGMWRSANFAFGQEIANYISFLNAHVPSDVTVVLPDNQSGPNAISRTPTMQLFLFPRTVINCTGDYPDCASGLVSDGFAALITQPEVFPGNLSLDGQAIMFNNDWGVYLPKAMEATGPPLAGFAHIAEAALSLAGVLLAIMVASIPGFLLARHTLENLETFFQLGLGFGISIGAITLSLYISLLLGAQLTPILVVFILILWWVLAIAGTRWMPKTKKGLSAENSGLDGWILAFVGITFLALVISIGLGYHQTDEINLWGPKGYGIIAAGLKTAASQWGTSTTAYPLNIPLIIGSLKAAFGDRLPESKVVFPLFLLGLQLCLYPLFLRYTSKTTAGLATLAIATAPLIFWHSTLAYANLPTTFYIFAGAALLSLVINAEENKKINLVVWGSLFLTLAAWTRPEAIELSGLILAIFWVLLYKQKTGFSWRLAWVSLFPIGAYAIFWSVTWSLVYVGSESLSGVGSTAIFNILQGNLRITEAIYILQTFVGYLTSSASWGPLFLLMIPLLLISLGKERTKLRVNLFLFSGIAVILAILLGYYLLAFVSIGGHDISWWVSTGLDRMLMPGIVLAWVGVLLMLLPLASKRSSESGSA